MIKKIVPLFIIGILVLGCYADDDSVVSNPINRVSFQIEKMKSDNDFISNAKSANILDKSSNWRLNDEGEIDYISKAIDYNVTLGNGEKVDFSITFLKKNANKDFLILDGEGVEGLQWDYKSTEIEAIDFYKNCEISISVDENTISSNANSENIKMISLEKALVNGSEKSFLIMNFNGTATGIYDSEDIAKVYEIKSGVFSGVVE